MLALGWHLGTELRVGSHQKLLRLAHCSQTVSEAIWLMLIACCGESWILPCARKVPPWPIASKSSGHQVFDDFHVCWHESLLYIQIGDFRNSYLDPTGSDKGSFSLCWVFPVSFHYHNSKLWDSMLSPESSWWIMEPKGVLGDLRHSQCRKAQWEVPAIANFTPILLTLFT